MPIKFLRDGYHHTYSFVEDKILLMLVALGGDNETIKSWFGLGLGHTEAKSLQSKWYNNPVLSGERVQQHNLHLHGLIEDDLFLHFL